MYDIIGDVHGCSAELCNLLEKLGYSVEGDPCQAPYTHKDSRQAVFVGDLCDRGPDTPGVIAIVRQMVNHGSALCVEGNHDNKLMRYLCGNKVKVGKSLQASINQLELANRHSKPITFDQTLKFLKRLPYKLLLDDGKLLVCHAGLEEKYHMLEDKRVQDRCLYGVTTGGKDADGYPIRLPWQDTYCGLRVVVHGHVALDQPLITNKVYNIDTSCVFGGHLTALRYPEMEFCRQKAVRQYWARGDH